MQEEIKHQKETYERFLKETHGVVERFIKGEAGPDEKVIVNFGSSSLNFLVKVSDLEIIAEKKYKRPLHYLVRCIPDNNNINIFSRYGTSLIGIEKYNNNYILRVEDFCEFHCERERNKWNFRPYKIRKLLSVIEN